MRIFELLSRLEKLGITLQAVNDGLKVLGPRDRLTRDLIEELRDKKPELIKLLQKHVQKDKLYISITPAEEKEYYKLSPAQKRLFIIQQMETSHIAYNMPQIISLSQAVDKEKLESVFKKIIARHESLRTSFLMVNDEPVQRVHDKKEVAIKIEIEEELPGSNPQSTADHISSLIRPFDLSRAPLLRVSIIKTSGNENVLILDMHHIITDGTSHSILKRECFSLSENENQELPRLRLQYKDYSQWLNGLPQQRKIKAQENYWLEIFAGEIPVLNLPLDFPRPEYLGFEGNTIDFTLNREETQQLKHILRERNITLYMALFAIYNILLAKLGGQEDIIVGTPIAARRHSDLEPIIGMFVNTLAVRIYPFGDKSLAAFFEEVKVQTLNAYENQEYPFEELVDKRLDQRDTSRNPLFDVMFNLMNQEDYPGEIPGTGTHRTPAPRYQNPTSKFDLNLSCTDLEEKLFFTLEYRSKLFKESTIFRIIDYFKTIVCVVSNPVNKDMKISGIEIVCGEEKKILLDEFNKTAVDFPREKSIPQLFEEQAAQTPEQVALIGQKLQNTNYKKGSALQTYSDTSYDRILLTYQELNKRSGQLANYLKERGVKPDTIVGLMVERSLEMIIGILGILKAGGAYLPIDAQYPETRKTYMLKDSGTRFLLASPGIKPETGGKSLQVIDISSPSAYSTSTLIPSSNLTCQVSPGNLVFMIYTSGSTGKPKGVLLEHRNLVNLLLWNSRFTNMDFSCVLQFATICFDASFHEIFSTLLSGGRLCLIPEKTRTDLPELFKIIEKHEIKTLFLPMAVLKVIFSEESYISIFPPCVEHIQTAGEQVVVSRRFQAYLQENNIHLHNHYGPTETHVVTALTLSPAGEIPFLPPIGKPVSNTGIYILDKYEKIQPTAVPGELYIGGLQVGRGYLNQPELTRERFITPPTSTTATQPLYNKKFLRGSRGQFLQKAPPGRRRQKIYKTGDLARWQPDGNVEFLGRIDSQVKIRGFRIEPGEIEELLLKKTGIKNAVVLAKEDGRRDKYLCAYIVCDGNIDMSGLREYLAAQLPGYMIPGYFIPIHEIPVTPNGKIDRKALPTPGIDAGSQYIAPRNLVEKKLVAIWSELLGIEKSSISIGANFFELGGHSLKATILTVKIHKELNVRVPMAEVFKQRTISGIARYIKNLAEDKYAGIEPVEKREYYTLSSAQKRIYFLQRLDLNSTTYNMPLLLPLGMDTDRIRLETTLKKLISRHENLRTCFEQVNEEPVQRILDWTDGSFAIEYYNLAQENTGNENYKIQNTNYKQITNYKSQNLNRVINSFIRPFDLSRAPLVRSGLFKHPDGNYTWIVDVHHIISDGTSQTILTEDFLALDNNEELPRLRLHYKDFSRWQDRLFSSGAIKTQEDYWLNLYKDIKEIARLQMPTDFKRPEMFTFAGDNYKFVLEREDAIQFKSLGSKHGGTLYMNILAALNTLFYKYTGQTDIIIGTGIAGRPHTDLQHIIGMFVNTLAMRNYPGKHKTYEDFLEEVIDNSVKAFENQDVQFEELVDRLAPRRDPSRNPLFDITMVVQNFRRVSRVKSGREELNKETENPGQIEIIPLADNDLSTVSYKHSTTKFDMTFFVHEVEEDVFIGIEYYTGIFKKETIHRLVTHFKQIIKTVIHDPGVMLKDIVIMSGEEKKEVLHTFNDTAQEYPRDKTITHLFEEQVGKTPDHTAVVSNEEHLTYRVLDQRSNQVAHYLVHQDKTAKEEIVGIFMDRSPGVITAILGVLKAGDAYLPICTSFPLERIKSLVIDSRAKILIGEKRYIKTLNQLQWECGPGNADTFLCLDSEHVDNEEEVEANELMSRKLWNYVGETASDEVTGGGWNSSYTGQPIPKQEMDEYGDNILKKLEPLLHKKMRVLEIGSSSGISMYRIAPRVGLYYGTDLSPVIIEKNRQRIRQEGHRNIKLSCLAAHEIQQVEVEERDFDLVILNSVIQCFNGHNYLEKVIRKAIRLMAGQGYIFIGDIMDQDLKADLTADLIRFKQDNRNKNYKTKIDWSQELFISRAFLEDLAVDFPEIHDMEFSGKIHTIENELTGFRYDAIIQIDKGKKDKDKINTRPDTESRVVRRGEQISGVHPAFPDRTPGRKKHKNQHDLRVLSKYSIDSSFPPTDAGPGTPAYIIYTSGSTGIPKGVVARHQNVVRLVKNTNYIDFTPGDKILQTGALEFDASTFEIWGVLLNGLTLYLESKNNLLVPEILKEQTRKNRITTMWMTAPFFNRMLDSDIEIFSGLKHLLVGGDALSPPHINRLRNRFPSLRVINGYGPTENVTFSTTYLIDKEYGESIPIGKPIANSTTYVVDGCFNLLPIGIAGELCVGGDGVASGYLNDVQLTGEKFIPNPYEPNQRWYRTGDYVKWLPDGNIHFLGRIDSQVKIRGFRIELGEIEHQLLKENHIKEAVVIHRDDSNGNKYLCAYIVTREEIEMDNPRDILSGKLPEYMIPSFFMQLEQIPLTSNGKIDRRALPEPQVQKSDDYLPPRTELEKRLAVIWSEVLQIDKNNIGIHANFFDLGGHSLNATIMTAKIHKALNIKVPLAEVFKHQCLDQLAKYMENLQENRYAGIKPVEKKEFYELSSAQKRLYFIQQVDVTSTAYNMPLIVPLSEDIQKSKLEHIIKKLITRHESLRTSFPLIETEPVQRVYEPDEVEFEIEYYDMEKIEVKAEARVEEEDSAAALISSFIRPFDLSQAPLMRSGLIRLADGNHTWLVDVHHIISDGTSHTILTEDFLALYSGMELPPLRLHYKGFSQWQNRLSSSGATRTQENYWLNLYKDIMEIPRLQVAADFKRPEMFTFAGDYYNFMLEREDTQQFKSLGSRHGGTLYMNILAVLNTLFYKYTAQTDIIIGTGIAGRPHIDIQHIIGMFINTLAMRNYPGKHKTYESFLEEVIDNSVKAFENQDVQFEELVDRLTPERDPSRNPLFDISMVVQNFRRVRGVRTSREELNGKTGNPGQVEILPLTENNDNDASTITYKNITTKFDMTFFVHEIGDDVNIGIEYYTGIFKKETIHRLTCHFLQVVKTVIHDPGILLKDIDIMSEEEKEEVLDIFNDTARDYPREKTIPHLFAEQVERTPDCIALVYENEQLTYKELDAGTNQLAVYLYYEKEVSPGSEKPVGVMLLPSLYRPVSLLGILKAGGVYVPLDPQLPRERIKFMIEDAGIGVVISGKKHIKLLNRLQWECESFHGYLCVDSHEIYEEEEEKSQLMDEELWHHVGENASDDISGGGWVSSYTGKPFSRKEMDEYSDNILKKLEPFLFKEMRVLEIGCASGISMYRIAPKVGLYYGTDLSAVIIEKNKQRVREQGLQNIKLAALAAHEIHRLEERNFDLIIMNSVVQCFNGHHYLRKVVGQCIDLLADKGYLFAGDIMDQEKKDELVRELTEFKYDTANRDKGYITKTDFSSELFLSRDYWRDMETELDEIQGIEFSDKLYKTGNELTKFRYDVLISINKQGEYKKKGQKRKHQEDIRNISKYDPGKVLFSSKLYPDNLAYIIYTSGTTGWPKGVLIGHRGIANLNMVFIDQFKISNRDKIIQFANISFDASIWEVFMALLNGAVLYLLPAEIINDYELFHDYLNRHQITIATLPPIYANHLHIEELIHLRLLVTAGSSPNINFVEGCINSKRFEYINAYGPTEDTICSSYWKFDNGEDLLVATIGGPSVNKQFYIVNENMLPQPIGVPGELCVSGPGLARGYLNRPELTADKFCLRRPGDSFYKYRPLDPCKNFFLHKNFLFYRTGDRARWLANGTVEFLGRVDQQVKLRGFRIEVEEIQNQLLKHHCIKDAAVIDRTGRSDDKYLCAYVTGTINEKEAWSDELREFLALTLPDYMIPSMFVQMEKLPLTTSGKVDLEALPEPEPVNNKENKYSAPRSPLENKLAEIWSEVLGVDGSIIGIHSDFFQLGGHSLRATVLVSRIHKELKVKIPLAEIFKVPTIKGLSGFIRQAKQDKYESLEPLEKKEYYALSPAQKRLYFIQQMDPEGIGYNMPYFIPLTPGIETTKVEATLKKLIARHEILRTSFPLVEAEPVQRVHEPDEIKLAIQYYDRSSEFIRPFDLSQPPLLRVGFTKKAGIENVLMIDMHHIISDGTSQGILERDFLSIRRGEESKLPLLKLHYKEYTQWLSRPVQQQVIKEQESYWLKVFAGELPVLNLPLDFPRPRMQRFEGNRVDFILNEKETTILRDIARENDVTLYMVLLAIFNILYSKLSGQEDIIIGTPIAARRHADLQHITGMMVNTLAMRNYPAPGKTCQQFLQEVKQRTLSAYENQEYPFEDLVEKVPVQRDTSRNPIFDVMLNLLNQARYPVKTDKLSLSRCSSLEHVSASPPFDMVINVSEPDEYILFQFEYCTRLFTKETAERFITYLKHVVSGLSGNLQQKLRDIDIIPAEEKRKILQMTQGIQDPVTGNERQFVHQLLERKAGQVPGAAALVFEDRYLGYGELNRQANRLANLLREKGMGPGNVVGLMMERSPAMIVALLAIIKAGSAILPIEPAYPRERILAILSDSSTNLLLTQAKLLEKLNDIRSVPIVAGGPYATSDFVFLLPDEIPGKLNQYPDENLINRNRTGDLFYVIYTSGSTGRPKGVMLEHQNLVNLLLWGFRHTNLDFSSVLQFATISFDASFHEIFSTLLSGGRLCLIPEKTRTDLPELFKIIERHDIKTLFLPMAVLKVIFSEEDYTGMFPRCVTHIQTAGEQVVISRRFRSYLQKNNIHLHNHYGPSEAHVVTALTMAPTGEIPTLPSIGKPVSNTGIYILDKYERIQPIGVPGELYIGGVQVGRGYLNQPELTNEKFQITKYKIQTNSKIQNTNNKHMSSLSYLSYFSKKIYKTGDLARWQMDENIEFLGRIDHQVKIRGFRIELGEIETCLLKKPGIKNAVVLAKEDERKDKYLCAYIVTGNKVDPPELRQYLSKHLPDYMLPAYFIPIDKIPVTPSGKVNGNALPAPGIEAGSQYEAPGDEVEKKLAAIWSELLGIEKKSIGVKDNFFELGGHSLKATILTAKIHKELNVRVPVAEIFKRRTISRLARYIKDQAEDRYAGIQPVEKQEYYRLSSAQSRIYFLQQMAPDSTTYNMPLLLPSGKDADKSELESTLKKLISRHENLRTSFEPVNEQPVQRIHDWVDMSFAIEYFNLNQPITHLENHKIQNLSRIINWFIRPFDLSRAPLVRSALIKHPGGNHTWIVDIHHIISDGTSQTILGEDFFALYQGKELARLRLDYKDFSQWQNNLFAGGGIKTQEDYWMGLYSTGEIPRLHLPLDHKRPGVFTYAGDFYQFKLEREAAKKFRALGAGNGATLYMNILALLNTLFYKYTGQTDIIIGSTIAARPNADLQRIIGMFINSLAMRNYPHGERSYDSFLKEIAANSIKAFENQDVQFEELVNKLDLERDPSRNPLFDICMVVQNFRDFRTPRGQEQEKTDIEDVTYTGTTAKFDMTFFVIEKDDEVFIGIEYYTGIFREETIKRLEFHVKNIINTVAAEPSIKIKDIDILTPGEKNMVLHECNRTTGNYPGDKTIHELFEQQAEQTPDHVAIVGNNVNVTMTYRKLDEKSNQSANYLSGEKHIGPGQMVGILMDNSVELIIALLGILKAGAAYVPLDTALPPERTGFIIRDTAVSTVISDKTFIIDGYPASRPKTTSEPGDTAYVIYTSGTTGKPKGVMIRHQSLVNYIHWASRQYFHQDGGQLAFPLYTSACFDLTVTSIYVPLITGNRMVIYRQEKDRLPILDVVKENKVDIVKATPSHLKAIQEHMAIKNTRLKKFILGGEELETRLAREMTACFKREIEIFNEYGPTEASVGCMIYKFDEIKDKGTAVPIGVPIDNARIYILDSHLQPVPPGVTGEIYIAGDGLAQGYINDPGLTAEKFIFRSYKSDVLYRTGDLARFLPDGNIEYSGRKDRQVKLRGYRIELKEIENHVLEHAGIKETAVLSLERKSHSPGEEARGDIYTCCYWVPVQEENPIATAGIKEFLSGRLPAYMVPSYFVKVEKIPLTPNGKVNGKALPIPGIESGPRYVPPRDGVEQKLAAIWSELLGIEKEEISIEANFFELGGHSLKATIMLSRIYKTFNIELLLKEIFRAPTIKTIAAVIKTLTVTDDEEEAISPEQSEEIIL